ncbi:MAG TPA: hypothetical protein VI937_01055, partial [Negativicutes bacterium]|nr:hypothetical protein [Negativicutes bacterium]
KAKDYIRGTMALSLDATDAKAGYYAGQEVMGKEVLTPEQRLAMIDKVTVSDIKKAAEDIFKNEKLNLSVIGPFEASEKEAYEKLLEL